MTRRPPASFLFLQGPPGPFFAQLAAGLKAEGHRCCRINFHGGDWLDWRGAAYDFTGDLKAWPDYLASVLDEKGVTDIVLFGDCRPLHEAAISLANDRRLAVHVFEEGYVRPDWVTLERGGVNGHSSLPRDPQEYLHLAHRLPPIPVYPPIPASFRQRAIEAFGYFAADCLLHFRFARYRSHRPYPAAAELAGWALRFAVRPIARLRAALTFGRLGQRRYFVLPLQLDSDHQIRTHSPFAGMTEAIERIVASFAEHASADTVLVVKEHPLDNGLKGWRGIVRKIASNSNIARRVLFLEHGHIDALVARAAGVVTVNSTTGTLALSAGTPVAVLGVAVYDLAGVTHHGGLDTFWADPGRPQLEIYEAFRRVLVARCLLRGGFSNAEARAHLVPAAVARLCQSMETSSADAPAVKVRA
ncbi:capsular biosynthesis protein [Sphingomonas sp. H39-1-10]|uniref:capsule biosynthesis protein n=1 Tax=Sphingomonas pollutisoli TaxID=3030829 RepID=UPI0023B90774|nr:capsular biosynthesis protein [Sphingomonas pollutisoli]MDF0487747.1 capsular biosynthesis protein [Sphingomonas pollutisoli]